MTEMQASHYMNMLPRNLNAVRVKDKSLDDWYGITIMHYGQRHTFFEAHVVENILADIKAGRNVSDKIERNETV